MLIDIIKFLSKLPLFALGLLLKKFLNKITLLMSYLEKKDRVNFPTLDSSNFPYLIDEVIPLDINTEVINVLLTIHDSIKFDWQKRPVEESFPVKVLSTLVVDDYIRKVYLITKTNHLTIKLS